MSALADFYPGDRFTAFAIVILAAVSVLCAAALLISRRLEHNPAGFRSKARSG